MDIHFILSEKGRRMLALNGYMYTREKDLSGGVTAWRCTRYIKEKCMSRVHIKRDIEIVNSINNHNHNPENGKIEARWRYSLMKNESRVSEKKPISIVADNLSNLEIEGLKALPSIDSIKRTLRRNRAIEIGSIAPAKSTNELQIPEIVLENLSRDIIFYDSLGEFNYARFLILINKDHLDALNISQYVYIDGSFYVASKPFYQILTLHSKLGDKIVPLVYCLLPNKMEETYRRVLTQIIKIAPQFKPKIILVDFEKALIQALASIFPNVELKGCQFHFSQAIIRKISISHKREYCDKSNDQFKNTIKSIIGIAFAPILEIRKKFDVFRDKVPVEIWEYLEMTYFGVYNNQILISNPIYPYSFWNVSALKLMNLPSTNNYVEGWHRYFNDFVGMHNPNLIILFRKIQKDMHLTTFKLAKMIIE